MNNLQSLLEKLPKNTSPNRIPPVSDWHPEREGSIDMRIDREGRWWHEGREIKRAAMVRVFSTILRKDSDGYVLVTPAERLLIQVEDVPFVGVDVDIEGQGQEAAVVITTNVEDRVALGAEHALTLREGVPYADVRFGLQARLARSAYYRLVAAGIEEAGELVIYSQQARFSLGATTNATTDATT